MPDVRTSLAAHVRRTHEQLAPARARLAARDGAVLQTQVALTEIPAPTGAEARRAAWVARHFRRAGFAGVRLDAAGNVIARHAADPSSGAREDTVVVCAHLDTVFPSGTAVQVRCDGHGDASRRLVAPGIVDNGRGLAVMLALAEEIARSRLRTARAIEFVATTGEEGLGDLRGAKHLFAARHGAVSAAIAIDGAGDDRVVHRALGSRRYRLAYRGPGGHSWAAYGVPNAVHAAAIAAARLAALPLPRDPRTTLSVGRIGGGIAVNAIPEDGWLEVDLRSVSAAALARLAGEIARVARAAADEENARRAPGTPPLTFSVTAIGDRPCGDVSEEVPLVLAALAATLLVDREPELATASTDANVPISLGIPAIAIGAGGRGGEAHSVSEWYENVDGPLGIGRALTIIAHAAGASEGEGPHAAPGPAPVLDGIRGG